MPSGKREAAQFHQLKALAAAQPEEVRTRRLAAEETLMGVMGRLGAADFGEEAAPGPTLLEGEEVKKKKKAPSIFRTKKAKTALATAVDPRYPKQAEIEKITRLKPEAYLKQLEKSPIAQIVSSRVKAAGEMAEMRGEEWDKVSNFVTLPIIQGGAAIAREQAATLKRMAQRGGSGRRAAMAAAREIKSQQQINMQTMSQVAVAHKSLYEYSQTNAQNVVNWASGWAQNLPGIRESFQTGMDNAAKLMLDSALPTMMAATDKAAQWRQYAHNQNRAKVGRWVSGIMGVVAMAAGLKGAGTQMLGNTLTGAGMEVPMPTTTATYTVGGKEMTTTEGLGGEGGLLPSGIGGFLSEMRQGVGGLLEEYGGEIAGFGAKSLISSLGARPKSPAERTSKD